MKTVKQIKKEIDGLRRYNELYGCTLLSDGRYVFHVVRDKINRLQKTLKGNGGKMISINDPFIQTQSDGLYTRVLQEETQHLLNLNFTSNILLNANTLAAHRLAQIATIAVYEKNLNVVTIEELKDEIAEMQKRSIPDGMEKPEIEAFSLPFSLYFGLFNALAIYGIVRIFV